MKTFAENVRRLRKDRGWSQTQLADRAGFHLTHINRVEAGKYVPSLDTAVKLAEVFETSLDDLVNEAGRTQVSLQEQTFAGKIKLLETMDEGDREAVSRIIDSLLTKARMLKMFREVEAG